MTEPITCGLINGFSIHFDTPAVKFMYVVKFLEDGGNAQCLLLTSVPNAHRASVCTFSAVSFSRIGFVGGPLFVGEPISSVLWLISLSAVKANS